MPIRLAGRSNVHPRCSFILIAAMFCFAVSSLAAQQASRTARFVGSDSCKKCHADEFNGWKQTRMANVVRDPKEHPEAVLGDFAHPTADVNFDLSQVAFVYGSRWKQRY